MKTSDIKEKAQKWLDSNIDDASKKAIREMMENDEDALAEAFHKDLEFGTGGLRGIMGVGSNRMNKYTVGMATQGLCNYLMRIFPEEEIKVVIAHDSRNQSNFFAETTAAVFSANGIKVYFFEEMRPTPELSFAIRHFECHSGVVITASHNPREYNGYKAYWSDGAQIISPHDSNIITEVGNINSVDDVNFEKDESKITLIGEEVDTLYLDEVEKLSLSPDAIERQKNIAIVYTPIHGTGIKLIPRALERLGFNNLVLVEEQSNPDGDFPTVVYPNPEESEAMSLGLDKAREIDADLLMATDPDADRVGIAVKNNHGDFQLINGNQTASLLVFYILKRWSEKKKITGNQFIANTIVTTDLIDTIAEYYGVENYNTLTGFKHIASVIRELENEKEFVCGGEESYGFMIGDFIRDKDAVSSCAMLAEIAAYAVDNDMNVFELIIEMYLRFGFYKEELVSIVKKGIKGAEEIKSMMLDLREEPPNMINNSEVISIIDYHYRTEKNLVTGKERKTALPISNVLQFFTNDGTKISARPSGTEPKIKFYISVNQKLESADDFDKVNESLQKRIDAVKKDLSLT